MKYVLLICDDETNAPTNEELADDPAHPAWEADLERRGTELAGVRLRPVVDATTVRVRDGETLVSDGPFAETKDFDRRRRDRGMVARRPRGRKRRRRRRIHLHRLRRALVPIPPHRSHTRDACSRGWDFYINESLKDLITVGTGQPFQKR